MIYIATDNYNDGFPLSNAYDDTIYQKANAEYYLKFRFPVDRLGIWKHLTCETILKADDTRGLQLFKIKKINKINGYVRVYAKHITDDLNFIGVDNLAVSNATGRRVMEALAGSTTEQHSFIFNSDIATMHTLNLTNTTAGKVLSKDKHSILGQWGGELIRDNFLVDLKARAGVDTEILFMNKKNVKNLDNAISTENITTRLKLSVEVEGEGNNKQTINATVDSPNINAYPRIYTNYLKVNSKTITNQEQLIEYGKKYFRDTLVDFPSDNLTVNVIDRNQERVNLFDTVWFRNVEFDIDKRLKAVAYEFSPMSKRYKKISFGALKVANFGQIKSLSQLEEKIDEKITESFTDAFKIQKNLSELLKLDRKAIEDKMLELEEKSKGAVEVKRALFEADGTIPDVVKTKILDAVEGDIGRLKTIITEAELIKAIQAKLNFAEIKNALIDKAFINQIISDERFTQQFEDGQVTTQNIFTKLKDSIKSNILKEVITKDGVKKIVNDLTVDADGIRQITQEEITNRREELKGKSSYIHTRYSDNANGSNFDTNSNRKYIGVYAGEKEQAPTNASEYSWTKIRGEDGARGRDGVSNYIHRKYSDNANGSPMSDNANLKYIGIYTGTSATAPTTPTSYTWSKIKGEDGQQGVPGARGSDGRTSYLHTAYSNSATGDRDFSTTNSTNKEYIGTYSDFEINDSNDYRRYKWVKIKGENGRDGNNGRDGRNGDSYTRNYLSGTADEKILTAVNDNFTTQEAFKLVDNKNFRDLGFSVGDKITFIADYEVLPNGTNKKISGLNFEWYDDNRYRFWMNQDLNPTKGTFTRTITANNDLLDSKRAFLRTDNVNAKIKITNARVIKGDTVQPWSIAQEDLQGHSLTANVRMEGRYVNNITNNVKIFAEVYYDGQRVTNGYTLKIKHKGGNNTQWGAFYTRNYTENGEILQYDWGNKEQNGTPLEVIVLIDYKGMSTVATARMENIPDIVEIKEITKKYKTFESTIDRFDSTIGEVKQQVLANEEKRNLIIGSRLLNDSDYKVFGKVWDGTSKQGIYTQIRQSYKDGDPTLYNGNSYLYVIAQNNTKNVWQGVGFKLSTNYLQHGVKYSLKIPFLILSDFTLDKGIYMEIKNHNTGQVIWKQRLDKQTIDGREQDTYKGIWIERTATFQNFGGAVLSDYSFWIYAVQNGGFCISAPYMCEGGVLPKNYSPAPEDVHLQNSRIESSITQVKNEIKSAVTENNFGTVLTQNATSLRLAWNNISNYVQFENGGMSFYDGAVERNKLRARIDDGTYSFWRDGYQVGSMGTGYLKSDTSKKGVSFFLENEAFYMGWGYRINKTDDAYSFKWVYSSKASDLYEADTLTAGCNVNFSWNRIKNFKFYSSDIYLIDGLSGTFNVQTDIGEETMVFKNGLLVER